MRLYTFTVTDEFGVSIETIYKDVQEILTEEAGLQGWADGYCFDLHPHPELLPDGSTRYCFEVEGNYTAAAV